MDTSLLRSQVPPLRCENSPRVFSYTVEGRSIIYVEGGRMSCCRPTEGLEPEYPRVIMVPVEEMSLENGLRRNDGGQNLMSCIW